MAIFLLIVIGLPVFDAIWWYWADVRLRCLRRGRHWRIALGAFVGCNLTIYGWLFLSRMTGYPTAVPSVLLGICYIWHLLILPVTILGLTSATVIRAILRGCVRLVRSLRARCTSQSLPETMDDAAEAPGTTNLPLPTRRQVLMSAMTAAPLVATGLGQIRAMSQLDSFRIRQVDLWLPTLPLALDGLTIAHLSDLHVGRFTNGPILDEVVARTNALCADLVMFSGDLIDHALADLPAGLAVLQRLTPQERVFMCEGNHDLFEGRAEFERRVRQAGAPLLVNESCVRELRGQRIQVLGLRWAGRGTSLDHEMDRLLPLRQSDTFTILLAHHPHAFDRAAEAGIPLTLAGHTHGGQLMLSNDVGAGSLLFKYCSGPYRQGPSALVVSNGVGNWFPLRVNAPAEILHLTLCTELPKA